MSPAGFAGRESVCLVCVLKMNFSATIISTINYLQHTAGSVTCFLWWDSDGPRGQKRRCVLRPPCCHISVETEGGQHLCILFQYDPLAAWHVTSYLHTHIHRHKYLHTHSIPSWGGYLCDELILSDRIDPASVTLCRSLWYPLNSAADQLKK